MAGINVCATLGGNNGRPDCDVRMGKPEYIMPTIGKEFTEEELQDSDSLKAALQAAMLLPTGDDNKVYLFAKMQDITNNTGDPETGTLQGGYEEVLNDALPKYLLRSVVGVCEQQAMASFNGWPGKVYVIDENGIFWYKILGTGGAGWSVAQLYTPPPVFKGGADVNTANTRLTFADAGEFKTGVGAVKLDFTPGSLRKLQDVQLVDKETENESGSANNVFVIGAQGACSKTDMYSALKDLMNSAGLWKAYEADGTALTIDSIAKSDVDGGWTVTINSTAYNGMGANDVFYIDWAAPSVLAAAGITKFEAKRIRFVKYA